MDPALAGALQDQLDRWQMFAPCLGSNVAIIDGRHGEWTGAAGFETLQPMPADSANPVTGPLPDFQGRTVSLAAFCNTTMGGHPLLLAKHLLWILAAV